MALEDGNFPGRRPDWSMGIEPNYENGHPDFIVSASIKTEITRGTELMPTR